MQISRRVYSSEVENMDVDPDEPIDVDFKPKKKEKKEKDREKASKPQKSSLLSFNDEGITSSIFLIWWLNITLSYQLTQSTFTMI